jgi:hypothetical protein
VALGQAPRERGLFAFRTQLVLVGRKSQEVSIAAFPLAWGGEVLFQLIDEGDLRRGGVYLLGPGEAHGRAPRFDELFRDVAAKARVSGLAKPLGRLVERARTAARGTRPRVTPAALTRLVALGPASERIAEKFPEIPGLPLDALVLSLALVFASEEERYPRPRYKGCDVARQRIVELLEAAAS